MSDKKPKSFRTIVPNLSAHASKRISSSSSSKLADLGNAIVFILLIPLFLIAVLFGSIIHAITNRIRARKAAPESLSAEQLEHFLECANDGDAYAQWQLALYYEFGCDGAPNYDEAMKWYEFAALNGNTDAQFKMGSLYESGFEEAPFEGAANYEEAIEWYRLAASEGNAYAQFKLGKMFANGRRLEQDDVQAYFWCQLAAEFNGMSEGCDHTLEEEIYEALDELKSRMTDSEIEEADNLVEKSFSGSS
jgi:TPR repeat protein